MTGYAIQKELMDRNGGTALWEGRLRLERSQKFGRKSIHDILK
jgi:hypothetical protein